MGAYVVGRERKLSLLRLIHQHPVFDLLAAVSDGSAGQPITDSFPHLASAWPGRAFISSADMLPALDGVATLAVFSAAPHGGSAASHSTRLSA